MLGEPAMHTDDHDLLIVINTKLERLIVDVSTSYPTLDARVRALENFRWWILGVASVMSFLGGVVAHLVTGK